MAGIFSGLMGGGGGSNSLAAAQYNQQLEDYALKRDEFRQQEAVKAIDPAIKKVLEDMSPERKKHLMLQRNMMQQGPLFDKGVEGFNASIKQRGGTIADKLKQAETLRNAKEKRDYYLENPLPSDNKKIDFVNDMIKKARLDPANADKTDWELAQVALRQTQYLDQDDQFFNTVTGATVPKRLMAAGMKKARADKVGEDLNQFYSKVETASEMLYQMENQRGDIAKLFGDTSQWTTAWGALMNWTPGSSQKDWAELKSTVISNIGLDKILALKASSAQGATGLGALNEAELKMLQDHLGSLDQARSPEALKGVMRRIDRTLERIQDRQMRLLKRSRADFNRNKKIIGMESDLPEGQDRIQPSQEYLFQNEVYQQPESRSTLGEDLGSIKERYDLE